MKRLVLALVLALVLVGSASAEPLATYEHTFEFGGSGSGSGSGSGGSGYSEGDDIFVPPSQFITVTENGKFFAQATLYPFQELLEYTSSSTPDLYYKRNSDDSPGFIGFKTGSTYSSFVPYPEEFNVQQGQEVVSVSTLIYLNGVDVSSEYSEENHLDFQSYVGKNVSICQISLAHAASGYNKIYNPGWIGFEQYVAGMSSLYPDCYFIGVPYVVTAQIAMFRILALPSDSLPPSTPDFTVTMLSEVQEPFFDLFGMRGLSASFTPSNPDEDYFILFAGSDSWVGQNPDKWIWTRVHGSTDKYKIIFSGNEYTWFVRYNDEIQQYSFTYTGEEGVVPPVIVPDPEPEPPVTPPIIDTPGEADPDYPTMPDIDSPDLTVDFTSGFDKYENMTIYQDIRNMIDGFTSSIAPNIETTQLYQSLQQVIAYLQLVMEQLKEKYAVPIYNILASVSSFVPSICWLAVDIAVIFGMFRFVVHIVTGPISSAIRERF